VLWEPEACADSPAALWELEAWLVSPAALWELEAWLVSPAALWELEAWLVSPAVLCEPDCAADSEAPGDCVAGCCASLRSSLDCVGWLASEGAAGDCWLCAGGCVGGASDESGVAHAIQAAAPAASRIRARPDRAVLGAVIRRAAITRRSTAPSTHTRLRSAT
jgi:hypothetical protein